MTAGCEDTEESPPAAPTSRPADKQPAGPKIVNVVDDFLAYHGACKDASAAVREAKWDETLEARHRDFFEQVIYRKLEGDQRAKHKQFCIKEFWEKVAPRIAEISRLNAGIEQEITTTLAQFRKAFPAFKPTTDFYVTISFSFHGKVADLNGKKVFAIGLENYQPGTPEIRITIAHEMFHLYHFQFFSASGGLYRPLWAEGLAVYASSVVVPGHRYSMYLGFPAWKMNRCQEMLPELAADIKKHMGEHNRQRERIYFGAEPNDTKVPPEAGYYVGLLMIESLAKKHSLDELARMDAKEVYKVVGAELDRLAGGG